MKCIGYGDSVWGNGNGGGQSPLEDPLDRDGETPQAGVDSPYEPVNSVGRGDGWGDGTGFGTHMFRCATEFELQDYVPKHLIHVDALMAAVIEVRLWSRRP